MTNEAPPQSDDEFDLAEDDALNDDASSGTPASQAPAPPGLDPTPAPPIPDPAPASPGTARRLLWRSQTVDALRSRPVNSQSPTQTEEHLKSLQAAQVQQLHQEHGQRRVFFWWAVVVVTLTLGGNFGIFLTYIHSQWLSISDTVMVSWIGATVVEVLGIAYIIATHLFPRGDKNGHRASGSEDAD